MIIRVAYKPPESVAELIGMVDGGDVFEIENKDGKILVDGEKWDKDTRLEIFKPIEDKIDAEIDNNEFDYSDKALEELKAIFKDGAFQLCNEATFKDATKDFKFVRNIKPGVKTQISLSDLASLLQDEAGTTSAVSRLEREVKKVASLHRIALNLTKVRQTRPNQ